MNIEKMYYLNINKYLNILDSKCEYNTENMSILKKS